MKSLFVLFALATIASATEIRCGHLGPRDNVDTVYVLLHPYDETGTAITSAFLNALRSTPGVQIVHSEADADLIVYLNDHIDEYQIVGAAR